jgi:Raf kinase inhibitor-like YbhB/YbcL family protein
VSVSGCKDAASAEPSPPPGVVVGRLAVTSRSMSAGATVPIDFTCDGANHSPPLSFSAPPHGTASLAVIFDDPDAGGFTHWTVYNLPPETLSLPEGVDVTTLGAATGENDFHHAGYAGPCPPRFEVHRYAIRIYALDARVDLPADPSRAAVDRAFSGHVLAQGTLAVEFSH